MSDGEAVTNTSLVSWLDRLDWSDLLDHRHQLCTSWLPLNHLYYQVEWTTLMALCHKESNIQISDLILPGRQPRPGRLHHLPRQRRQLHPVPPQTGPGPLQPPHHRLVSPHLLQAGHARLGHRPRRRQHCLHRERSVPGLLCVLFTREARPQDSL